MIPFEGSPRPAHRPMRGLFFVLPILEESPEELRTQHVSQRKHT